jgi:hypothetical protein
MPATFAAFGALTFDGVVGKVIPRTTKTVRPIENPAQVPAAERLSGAFKPSRLEFNGWFSATQADALYAMQGYPTSCHDETGTLYDVLVHAVDPRERPCLSADGLTLGVWIEMTATVEAWA